MSIGKFKLTYSGVVDMGGIIAAITVVGGWCLWGVQFIPRTRFALLALLPGSIALIYYFGSALPRYLTHQEGVTDYIQFCQSYDRWWQETGWPRKLTSLGLKCQRDVIPAFKSPAATAPMVDRPYFAATLWASICLTFVFMIAASMADDHSKLSGRFPELVGQTVTMSLSSTRTEGTALTTGARTDTVKTDTAAEAAKNDSFVIQ